MRRRKLLFLDWSNESVASGCAMSVFDDFSFSPEEFSGTARLFPLPNLVLFPHVMQPLHVFEARYREMVEEALRGDRLIAMAVLAPGWEKDYEGQPPVLPVACLGRVAVHHRLSGGAYNVLLVGLRRVRMLGELSPAKHFRQAKVELCEDVYPPEEAAATARLQRRLRKAFLCILPQLPQVHEQLDHLLSSNVSLGVLTDIIAYTLDIGMEQKHALLAEPNVHRRAEQLLGHLAEAARDISPGQAGVIAFPPQFSPN